MKSRCIKKSQETFKKINFNVLLFYIIFDYMYIMTLCAGT